MYCLKSPNGLGDPSLSDVATEGLGLSSVQPLPIFKGGSITRKALYWHYPHYSNQGGIPSGAIRVGDWKLIERYEDGRVHLYNLKNDIGELNDLALSQPSRVQAMRQQLHGWYRELDAKFLQSKDPWRP